MLEIVLTQEAPTRVDGSRFDLAPRSPKTFRGGRVPFHRKQIIISNENSSLVLYVIKGTGEDLSTGNPALLPVFPQDNITVFTSDDITVFNASASGTIRVSVMEVFYKGDGG